MSKSDPQATIASLKAEITTLEAKLKRAETAERNFRDALQMSPVALCQHDTDLRYTWLYNGHLGFSEDQVIGKTDWDILAPDLADRLGVIKHRVLRTGKGERCEIATDPGAEDCRYFDLAVEPVRDPQSGLIIGLACSGVDVTEDRQRRERYRNDQENLQFIFSASPLPITVTDIATGQHLFFNNAADQLFSINSRHKQGYESGLFDLCRFPGEIRTSLEEGRLVEAHRFEFIKQGKVLHLSLNAKQIFYNNQAAILATFTDLTQQIEQHNRLEAARKKAELLAHTDMLTQLDNRRSLFIRCEQALGLMNRASDHLTAIVIDIDFFKKINDTWGHATGDKAIARVGRLLRTSLRQTDIAARYGGEEFALILPDTTLAQGVILAEKLRCEIAALKIEAGEQEISISASLGVAEYHPGMNEVGELLNAADMALYQAKSEGRNRVIPAPGTVI
ncbi:sensor domain-containing diguanylate cyclase [Neptuniibacter halophilus]|uniref:sensor domain-containing diguanylate cyclase n=1 Tax=Neptuniibacter halophilus TaxID=651666 RepID=UPI0025737861|nr:GGDEF domain-containing protein [Neptuniibacter halophilus]